MKKPFLRASLLVLGVCAAAQAQGQYLAPGQSGLGVFATFGEADGITSLGASVGYSLNGVADFGFGLTRHSFDDGVPDANGGMADVHATAYSPSLTVHVIKQDLERPFSVSLGAAYEHGRYDSDAFDDHGVKLSVSGWMLGGSIYSTSDVTSGLQIQPRVTMAHVSAKSRLEDAQGNSVSDTEDEVVFGFDLSFLFKTGGPGTFVITPGLGVADSETTLSVKAGFVFPTP